MKANKKLVETDTASRYEAIVGVRSDNGEKQYYNVEESKWVDSRDEATKFVDDHWGALMAFTKLTRNKDNIKDYRRVFVPVFTESLSEVLSTNILKDYKGPGYYNFQFLASEPINTGDPNIYGETGRIDDYPMIGVESEDDFINFIKTSEKKTGMLYMGEYFGATKMRDFYEYEGLDSSDETDTYGKKAYKLNNIISCLNDENAYGDWIYIWPDGSTEEDAEYYFETEEDYNDLYETFVRIYKRYHNGGLHGADDQTIVNAHEFDKLLNLPLIEIV